MAERTPATPAEIYNDLGQAYEEAFGHQPALGAALTHLLPLLPERSKILDVGSGTGATVALTCAEAGHDVTGCDVSEKMIELSRTRVPGARFELTDMRDLNLEAGTWNAILAFFSMLQLPREDQDAMVVKFARWLAPGGYLILATVPRDSEGRVGEWMGHWVQTFSYPVPVWRQRLEDAGLQIVRQDIVAFTPASDQAHPEPQVYFTARKPK